MSNSNSNIPLDILEIFTPLSQEVTWLYAEWELYSQLFLQGADTSKLLRRFGKGVFVITQRILMDSIILTISRLTDPSHSGGSPHLSLENLYAALNRYGASELSASLRDSKKSIESNKQCFRDIRDSLIAHADLKRILASPFKSLPPIQKEMIEKILADIASLLNTIQGFYDQTETRYHQIQIQGEVHSLLNAFDMAIRYQVIVAEEFEKQTGKKL